MTKRTTKTSIENARRCAKGAEDTPACYTMPSTLPVTSGYGLNAQTVRRDLYRLSTMLLSYDRFATAGETLLELRDYYVDDEFAYLLVGSALANRLQMEFMYQSRSGLSEFRSRVCGCLESKGTKQQLQFLDACNKIIHSGWNWAEFSGDPSLYVCGVKSKTEWSATIDIIKYLELSVRNFDDALPVLIPWRSDPL